MEQEASVALYVAGPWVKKLSGGLLKCEGCGVSLCSWCFKPFHVLNVFNDAVKAKMCIEITDRKNQHGKKKRNVQRK